MEISLLKEPLGFLRLLEWIFAIAAFATCANFSTNTGYHVDCKYNDTKTNETVCFDLKITKYLSYPFNLDTISNNIIVNDNINATNCLDSKKVLHQSEDNHLGATIFIFVGVSSWMVATFYLALFIFCPYLYLGSDKKGPIADLCASSMIAILWLLASSAWAHGVIGFKYFAHDDWLYFSDQSPCLKNDGHFINKNISDCFWYDHGSFGGANASILMGFLNSFLWFCNMWFIYKETNWFHRRNPSYNIPDQQQHTVS